VVYKRRSKRIRLNIYRCICNDEVLMSLKGILYKLSDSSDKRNEICESSKSLMRDIINGKDLVV